ncbi:MAG: ribose 5-phosphate isomerase B [Deltaproteobacteria bacterium]|nr:ribose 5-phosphate isomerase B [Candidatus Anaeroferrophillus wilburensis]MBN2889040.1 ribose 5-phosphate isomerase B [Deltaproteobacteria bacterium]
MDIQSTTSSLPPLLIASDHGGYALKEELKTVLSATYEIVDLGTNSDASVDYPAFAYQLTDLIANGSYSRGIIICGTGIGMSIAANRNPKVRAALATTQFMAQMAREHNDANVLVLGGRILTCDEAIAITKTWLTTPFAGGRHERRVEQLGDNGYRPPASVRNAPLAAADRKIHQLIMAETRREEEKLVMIASENYVSQAVLEAQGSVLTNKYAEGYPFKRYYGGCQVVDEIEQLAIDRAKDLFGAEHANVQPLSGSSANMAVYLSVLEPGDTILGMNLAHGGHLTHGAAVSFSGRLFRSAYYGVDQQTNYLDYDEIETIAVREQPKIIIAGASSYSRELDFPKFRQIADRVNALLVVDMAHIAGLVAAGAHPSPVPYADFVTTTTHKTLRGPRGGMILCKQEFASRIDKTIFPGIQGGPLMHVIAAKAVAFQEAMTEQFRQTQHQTVTNARHLAACLQQHGFTIVSGGTDNHLFLIDLTTQPLKGKRAEEILDEAGITINKNGIPFDQRPPTDPGGIRIGTPIVSTRGMQEAQMETIADFFAAVLRDPENDHLKQDVNRQVKELCSQFPVYRNILTS